MSDFFISKSKIETYIQCGLKFDLKYIKKESGIIDFEDSQSTLFGNVVHKALEVYFNKENKREIQDIYKEEFIKSEIVNQEQFNKGLRLIEDYVKSSESTKIIGLELPFSIYLKNGIPVKGVIDRLEEVSPDELEVMDYKTGYLALTDEEIKNDIQLGIYELVTRELYPKYKKIKLTLNYLHYGKLSTYRTEDDRKVLEDYLYTMYNKMVNLIKTPKLSLPRINKYCSYCEFKHKCPAFQALVKDDPEKMKLDYEGLILKPTGLIIDFDKLDQFHESIKYKIKILKKLEDDLKAYIKEHIKTKGSGFAKIGRTNYSLANKKYTSYNVNEVLKLFKGQNIDYNYILDAKKMEIDKILKNDEKSLEVLRQTSKVYFSDSYVK